MRHGDPANMRRRRRPSPIRQPKKVNSYGASDDQDMVPTSPIVEELKEIKSRYAEVSKTLTIERLRPTRPFLEEGDGYEFLYRPHTVTAGIVLFLWVVYAAFVYAPAYAHTQDDRIRLGFVCTALVFLGYCMVQMRDSLILRPHPAFWRVVHGAGILYLLALVVLLMQNADGARALARFFMTSLDEDGPPLDNSRVYAADCRLRTPGHPNGEYYVVRETLWDIFMIAHAVGWWGKALMLRDWKLAMTMSIMWELIEYSFQHQLPNFAECWWDHWIIDVLVCNLGGLALGMFTCRWLEMMEYDWTDSTKDRRVKHQVKRAIQQFTPYSFTKYTWDIFGGFKRFVGVMFAIAVMTTVELNAFMLKNVLWIPPSHPFNSYRLLLWFVMSVPGLREYYQYVTDPATKRMGQGVWLGLGVMLAELFVCVKFGPELYSDFPWQVVRAWFLSALALGVWCLLAFDCIPCWRPFADPRRQFMRNSASNACIVCVILPLVWMVFQLDVGWGADIRSQGVANATSAAGVA